VRTLDCRSKRTSRGTRQTGGFSCGGLGCGMRVEVDGEQEIAGYIIA